MSNPSEKKGFQYYNELATPPVESWLTSYGDLMTILLVFFVMLISASHVSALKFERIKQSFQGPSDEESIAKVMISLEQEIAQSDLGAVIDIETDGNSIQISFHDQLLFDLGKAHVKEDGLRLLEKFSQTLAALPDYAQIAIEGYTDDNPVNRNVYQSNWHLSALRSLSVLEILEQRGICRENCEVRGFGEFRPTAPNRDDAGVPIAENQSENRRVVLRIF